MKSPPRIRPEHPSDIAPIESLTAAAFLDMPYSSHTEHFIVNALRRAGRLTLSLVAMEADDLVGHIAISPVSITGNASAWFGLGPLSVTPMRQREGFGSELVKEALAHLKRDGAAGCVVLGDPDYYSRFGFKPEPTLVLPDVPAEYFQAIAFQENAPTGTVAFDKAFDARA
ncbi:GCN5-related N-acetyltransferase [Caballeronia catudaia]|uniref:GCN5-related N-acetyltransferase n=1 Tax=Caballeronia catudaia TaxID=1777136 RepID=A0A157ZUA2_9BURK|nr:N-acetyltransferase [Caballeronia catudaia]SAK49102.1 GCN5-related N-acetyltransferase [Caballeronia catudaia]